MVLIFILVDNLIPNRQQWWWALTIFLALGVAEAVFGSLARALFPFGINLGVQVAWFFTEPVPYGTFEEGNLFGSHIASWGILLLMLLLAATTRRQKIWRLLGLVLLLIGLFLSLSRAAWLTFAVGATIAWIIYRPNSWRQTNWLALLATAAPFVVVLVFAAALTLPSSWPFVDRLQSFLNLQSDATFSARLSDWAMALQDWLQHPLTGWGPGSFYMIHGELRANPAWISNLGLRLLQETGLLGAAAFVTFVLTLVLPAIKRVRQLTNLTDRAALLGLTLSYIVLIGVAYQSTDGIWIAASWVHAGLIVAGVRVLRPS